MKTAEDELTKRISTNAAHSQPKVPTNCFKSSSYNMQIRYKIMSLAYIPLLCLIVQNANGFPFEIYSMSNELNISSLPRSIHPYLTFKQQTHHVPPKKTSQQIEDELLTILETMKVCKISFWIARDNLFLIVFFKNAHEAKEKRTSLDRSCGCTRIANVPW